MKIPTGSTCVYVTIPGKIVNMTQIEKPKNRVFSFNVALKKVKKENTNFYSFGMRLHMPPNGRICNQIVNKVVDYCDKIILEQGFRVLRNDCCV